ncbi:MAG TPA: lysophospholipid acyltransferase family protein [Anaerolineales bacterium]|nr:lysophospholipid acyltransferase family protein [Anaerolineales bacterium]
MPTLRAITRLFFFSIVTLVTTAFVAIGYYAFRFRPEWVRGWQRLWVRVWARCTAFILNIRIHTIGTPPTPPFFLASNHLSYVDALAFFCTTHCIFVIKHEISQWPFFGFACKVAGMLFVNRENALDVGRVTQLMEQALKNGGGLVLFPEATTSNGSDLLPFHTPLLEPTARLQIPLHYASLHFSTPPDQPPASDYVCWWGDVGFFSHLWKLAKLSRIDVTIHFCAEPLPPAPRKALTKQLVSALRTIFVPSTR